MKKILLLFIILTSVSCQNSTYVNSQQKIEQNDEEINYKFDDMLLKINSEKIGLLSIIHNVPQEKAHSVLIDYFTKTNILYSTLLSEGDPVNMMMMEDPNYIINTVDSIAQKNSISKKMAALIIFSYQYEMVTEDEVIDKYLSKQ